MAIETSSYLPIHLVLRGALLHISRSHCGIGRRWDVRFHIDPDTDQPHIYGHGVSEDEVRDVLKGPVENRAGSGDSRVLLGRTRAGRFLRAIVSFDDDGQGVFVITAFPIIGKPLKALRRRMRRRGEQ